MASKRAQTKLVSEANKALAKLAKTPVEEVEVEEDDYIDDSQEEHTTRFGSLHPGGGAVSLGGTPVRIK